MARVTEQDFLNVCSFTEWKSTRQIRQELEAQKEGFVSYGAVYNLAERLEEKGFIEIRQMPDTEGKRRGVPSKEIKLTEDGIQEKQRLHREEGNNFSETVLVPA